LFHPRSDTWVEHFKRQRGRIIGTTPVGRTTLSVLNMNHPDAVRIREELIADGRLKPRYD
jgi:rRNA processing protein Krr1/Pno1